MDLRLVPMLESLSWLEEFGVLPERRSGWDGADGLMTVRFRIPLIIFGCGLICISGSGSGSITSLLLGLSGIAIAVL
jgi:hypothetical protein